MPPRPTVAQIRLNNIVTCLDAAVATLEVVSDSLMAPFLGPISTTARSLLIAVQTIKKNKDDCMKMLEQLQELLYGIIYLHIHSDTSGKLSPSMLHDLGKFTETLHKIHIFVEAQQERSRMKQFFQQAEMSTLLKDCRQGLEHALNVFKVQGLHISNDVIEMRQFAEKMHQEVLELISALSDGVASDRGSSISRALSSIQNSSNSLSLLPPEPKIFHGRESEVSAIIQMFNQGSPRIAILGTGGMGKTSLARAVLHRPEITAKYDENRVFVACDAIASSVELAALIGAHVGLKPGKDLTRPIIHHFASSPHSLLILDNLETIWEPKESRGEVENFLALLADVQQLALIITMRGAERPAYVQWTRPFLEPLKPLSQDAARKMVIDIVDDGYALEDIDRILLLADNMPLAIDLIAHLVDYEGIASVLHRWEIEKTSLLSEGHDKGSNLDLSISLSLASHRIMSLPESRELLSLLSILPDGISDVELVQSKLPIKNILACKATLLRTSLAYTDGQRRLKALVPIREYVHKTHPPAAHLVQPLVKYFHNLLELFHIHGRTASSAGIVPRIAPNIANIQSILVKSL
ncbi:P-loop containing nucleoside triphosphate hydrolase protein, partial [Mycena latifolia]